MAVRTKEEMLNLIKGKIGDDTSDESIALIEDINDTFDEYEKKAKDTTDWEKKYNENDKAWRKKYRDRFFGKVNEEEKEEKDNEDSDDNGGKPIENLTFENLFKEE